jgi:hypothetical protein
LGDPVQDATTAELILSLAQEIRHTYGSQIKAVNGEPLDEPFEPTDTLITKILLGTIGCTPACDDLFIRGFRHKRLEYPGLKAPFLHTVFGFYSDHQKAFEKAQRQIKRRSHITYPPMKLVDMYFWQIGYRLRQERKGLVPSADN